MGDKERTRVILRSGIESSISNVVVRSRILTITTHKKQEIQIDETRVGFGWYIPMLDSDWTVVSKRKVSSTGKVNTTPAKIAARVIAAIQHQRNICSSDSILSKEQLDDLFVFTRLKLHETYSLLSRSSFTQLLFSNTELMNKLNCCNEIFCLGIGKFSSSMTSMYQLCLMMHLRKMMRLDYQQLNSTFSADSLNPPTEDNCVIDDIASISIFEPLFTDVDQRLCVSLNFTICNQNKMGMYSTDSVKRCLDNVSKGSLVLYFMPHCPYRLYVNVLWANWSEGLDRLCILGNRY